MRRLIVIMCVLVSFAAQAQDYNFSPKWKKGDKKTVSIVYQEKEWKGDELTKDTTIYSGFDLKVLSETDDSYKLEVLYENVALRKVMETYDKFEEEFKEYQKLKLIYRIDKATMEYELLNWEEASTFIKNGFDQMLELVKKKSPESGEVFTSSFEYMKSQYDSEEMMKSYMGDEMDYLLIPFNKELTLGDTLELTDSGENPFNPKEEVSVTQKFLLKSVDKNTKTCEIDRVIDFDLSEFVGMMKEMMIQLATSFGASDSIARKKMKEIDDMEMTMETLQTISFNYSSTWATKVVSSKILVGAEPMGVGLKSVQKSTVTIQ